MTFSFITGAGNSAAKQGTLKTHTAEFRRVLRAGVTTCIPIRLYFSEADPDGRTSAGAIQRAAAGFQGPVQELQGREQGTVIGHVVGSALAGNTFAMDSMGGYIGAVNIPRHEDDIAKIRHVTSHFTSLATKYRNGAVYFKELSGLTFSNPTLAAAIRSSCYKWQKFEHGKKISNKLSVPPFFAYGSPIHVMAWASRTEDSGLVRGLLCAHMHADRLRGQLRRESGTGNYAFSADRNADPYSLGVYSYAGANACENTTGDTGRGNDHTPILPDPSWTRPCLGDEDRDYHALDDFCVGLQPANVGSSRYQEYVISFLGFLYDLASMHSQLVGATNDTFLGEGATEAEFDLDWSGVLSTIALGPDSSNRLSQLSETARSNTSWQSAVYTSEDDWAQGLDNNYKTRNFEKVVHRNGAAAKEADTRLLRFRPIIPFGYQSGTSDTSDAVEKVVNLRGDRAVTSWFERALSILAAAAQASAQTNALHLNHVWGTGRPDQVDLGRGSLPFITPEVARSFILAFALVRSIKEEYPDLYPMCVPCDRFGPSHLRYLGRLGYMPWGCADDLRDHFTPTTSAQGFVRTPYVVDENGDSRFAAKLAQGCWFRVPGTTARVAGEKKVARARDVGLGGANSAAPYLVPVNTPGAITHAQGGEIQARTWMNYIGESSEGASIKLGARVLESELGFHYEDSDKQTASLVGAQPFHDRAGEVCDNPIVKGDTSVNVSHGLTLLANSVKESELGDSSITDGAYAGYTPAMFAIKKIACDIENDDVAYAHEDGVPMYNASNKWKGSIISC